MLDKYTYVFVITYGRSGSTLLMKLLNAVDGFDLKGENHNNLFHLFQSIRAIDLSRDIVANQEITEDHPWYGADRIDREAFARTCLDAFVAQVLRPSPGSATLGFKEIRHLDIHMGDDDFVAYMDFLRDTFPGARIIFNTRDAAQVRRSAWFAKQDPDAVTASIHAADRRFAAYAQANPCCFVIDYQDMIDRSGRLDDLFAFLGSPAAGGRAAEVLDKPLTHLRKRPGIRRRLRDARRGFMRGIRGDG
ncbi:MAG: sulfotransferase [Hyphomicrobiales bacterium]|nr:sulfotransferase [Hyphomicrobiales bacterium]MCP5373293.1 sulfotransferase [Hyphomicrobiales bacterium]